MIIFPKGIFYPLREYDTEKSFTVVGTLSGIGVCDDAMFNIGNRFRVIS